MPPDETTQQMLREVLRGQQDTAVAVARVEEILTGHIDRQAERTRRRDERCVRSESRTAGLESAMSDLQTARAGESGGQTARAGVANRAMSVVALCVAAWAALKGR